MIALKWAPASATVSGISGNAIRFSTFAPNYQFTMLDQPARPPGGQVVEGGQGSIRPFPGGHGIVELSDAIREFLRVGKGNVDPTNHDDGHVVLVGLDLHVGPEGADPRSAGGPLLTLFRWLANYRS